MDYGEIKKLKCFSFCLCRFIILWMQSKWNYIILNINYYILNNTTNILLCIFCIFLYILYVLYFFTCINNCSILIGIIYQLGAIGRKAIPKSIQDKEFNINGNIL